MGRVVGRIVVEVVGAILVALVLLGIVESIRLADVGAGIVEGARLLFLFMDIGLGIWALLLIILAARSRGAEPGMRATLQLAIIGTIGNLVTVNIVGFAQQGGWAGEFVCYATEAGIAFLVAAFIVVPLVHRALPVASAADAAAS